MASLLETRKKIDSVRKTRKITKAMQLVSASKMKVFQRRAVSSRGYAWDLLAVLKNHITAQQRQEFMEKRNDGKILFVLYSSDKGLCGPLNSRLIKTLLNSKAWNDTPADQRLLVTIGRRAFDFAKYNKIPVAKSFKGLPENMTSLDALEFIKPIIDYWTSKEVKRIYMIAPHYKSTLVFYPMIKTFLPFSFNMIGEHLNVKEEAEREEILPSSNTFMYYEPDEDRIIEVMFEQIIQLLFVQSFYELKAAEYSSRMIAMQNATDNADEITDKLTLLYNKGRQAKITQELSEISGAIAAM